MLKLRPRRGVLKALVVCAVIADLPFAKAQAALPSGWAQADIGQPAAAGSASFSAGTFTIRGAGDIYGTFDQFHFVYRTLSGDVDIRARVVSVNGADPWAKVGLMVRESTNAGARNAFMLVSAGHVPRFQWRSSTGGTTALVQGATTTIPVWLRLVRMGNVFRAYTSSTGATWTLLGSATIGMNATAYVGLAISSHMSGQTATATLSNVSVTSILPVPWKASDIGSPGVRGSASANNGTFTVKGAGAAIWGTVDQFQFVYQPVTGNREVVARVASLQSTDGRGKVGVMIRAALTGSAAHASMFARSSGWAFQRRLVNGGTTYHTSGTVGVPPGWVRVVREGNLFSAYQSTDGSHWRLVDTDTISMPTTVYVGLAVSSQNTTTTATGTFTNIQVAVPGGSNTPPTVSISSPRSGATYAAPATMPISATAGDVDGGVTRVNFYAGSTLVGTDTVSPWGVTWGSVPAGIYSLRATATDNDGAQTTSAAISVTVTAPPPASLVFVPGMDYVTNATSCTVALRRASDPVTSTPVASRNLGKPAAVNGQISVDISALVNSLPLGSYYAVVVTTGPGGSTPSSPSPTFSR